MNKIILNYNAKIYLYFNHKRDLNLLFVVNEFMVTKKGSQKLVSFFFIFTTKA